MLSHGLKVNPRLQNETAPRLSKSLSNSVALALKTGVSAYQIEDEEGRMHLLIHLPIEEQNEDRWCLWQPDHAGFDSSSIFERALIEK